MSVYLLVGILLLQHDGQSLQEGPHAGCHVETDHALLLQSGAAGGQHVAGCHELFGAVNDQHILETKQTRALINNHFRNMEKYASGETPYLGPVGADSDAHIWDPDDVLDRT